MVSVARLVSALETLLPITTTATAKIATKTTTTSSVVAGDRNTSSFSLPDIAVRANIIANGVDGGKDAKGITGDDVRTLLQSTRRGKIIDIRTVTHLIENTTKHFQTRHPHRLVTFPPLRDEQQLSVIGDLHGSLSDLATVLALQAGDDTINSKLDGSHKIDAEHTWDLLDSNGDGRISISEWEKLGQAADSELWQNMEPIETAQAWK